MGYCSSPQLTNPVQAFRTARGCVGEIFTRYFLTMSCFPRTVDHSSGELSQCKTRYGTLSSRARPIFWAMTRRVGWTACPDLSSAMYTADGSPAVKSQVTL